MASSSLPCACTTVRKANRSLFRYYEKAFSKLDITITQFAILRNLERKGPIALSRLADEMIMERTSLYRAVQTLEKRGAIQIDAQTKGKAKMAQLAPEGTALIVQALPYWQKAQSQFVDVIGHDKWKSLSDMLLQIPSLVDELPS